MQGYIVGTILFLAVPYAGGLSFIRVKLNKKVNFGLYSERFYSNQTLDDSSATTGTLRKL